MKKPSVKESSERHLKLYPRPEPVAPKYYEVYEVDNRGAIGEKANKHNIGDMVMYKPRSANIIMTIVKGIFIGRENGSDVIVYFLENSVYKREHELT